MVLSDTVAFVAILGLTIVFTSFALVIKESYWRVALKMVAGTFWWVMAIAVIEFFGTDGLIFMLCLPFALFGLLFVVSIVKDALTVKHNRIWSFDED